MKRESTISANKDPFVSRLGKSVIRVFDDYLEAEEFTDVPWRHGECATVGFVSAAAWKMGAVSLLEYPDAKKRDDEPCDGRYDLYIRHAKRSYFLEAKWCMLWGHDGSARWTNANRFLDAALRDAQRCAGEIRYAVCFLAPVVQRRPRSLRFFFEDFCQELRTQSVLKADSWSYLTYFHPGINVRLRGGYWPGVVVAFRKV